MADFHRLARRLLWLVVGLVLGGVSTWASAGFFNTGKQYGCPATSLYTSGETIAAACANVVQVATGAYHNCGTYTYWVNSAINTTCNIGYSAINPTTSGYFNVSMTADGCPAGQYWPTAGAACSWPACPAGEVRNPTTNVCEVVPSVTCQGLSSDDATKYTLIGWQRGVQLSANKFSGDGYDEWPGTRCRDNSGGAAGLKCSVTFNVLNATNDDVHCRYDDSAGFPAAVYCDAPGFYTGDTCTVADEPVAPTTPTELPVPPTVCPTGQCSGDYNGTTICVPCNAPSKPTTSTETKTNPDGSTVTTVTSSTTACDPLTGKCTTTTSTTTTSRAPPTGGQAPGAGDVTGVETATGTSEAPIDSFCEKNPDSDQCKKSAFGGSCSASFTCDGDAVQCAIAKEQHKRNCKLYEDQSDLADLGNAIAAGADPLAGTLPDAANPESVDIGSSLSSASGFLGRSCPADRVFSLAGQSITLPYSDYCWVFEMAGSVLLALASLVAVRLIIEGL